MNEARKKAEILFESNRFIMEVRVNPERLHSPFIESDTVAKLYFYTVYKQGFSIFRDGRLVIMSKL